jgi:hypothetical protein
MGGDRRREGGGGRRRFVQRSGGPRRIAGFAGWIRQRRRTAARVLVIALSRQIARLGSDDRRFDDHVVGAADHQQMFDIIASHDDKLALPIEIEGVDDAQTRLASPRAAWTQAIAHRPSIDCVKRQRGDRQRGEENQELKQLIVL